MEYAIEYNSCHIIGVLYRFAGKWWYSFTAMDTNGLPDCFEWFKDATALMQSGKAYENLRMV
jgi:hypothetical protein